MEKPLVDKTYILQKYPGKGGWTYAAIDEVKPDKKNPFGWIRVKGSVDGFVFQAYHLMPMGNGRLFLPVKSEIRKKIKKQEGDKVHVILYLDNTPTEIPQVLREVLAEDKRNLDQFLKLPDGEQQRYINWIYAAKTDDTKVKRIVRMLEELK